MLRRARLSAFLMVGLLAGAQAGERPASPVIPAVEGQPVVDGAVAPSHYPPAPSVVQDHPELAALLAELEAEAGEQLPLFGQRVFRQAIIDRTLARAAEAPPVVTPSPTYQLYPGDKMTISFWNRLVEPVQIAVEVDAEGRVTFAPVGSVQVAGLTVAEFERVITDLIQRRGPREATVRISYTGLHALQVRVSGELRRPTGSVVLSGYATLFDALAAAGGPTAVASLRRIRLYRGGQSTEIDLYRYLLTGDPAANPALRDGDSLHVPVARQIIQVTEQVARPARYELLDETRVTEALELAGGLRGRASIVQVQRVLGLAREQRFDFPAADVLAGRADLTPVEPLRHGDVIRLIELGRVRETVTITGAVGREGEFGWRPGLTLGELVTLAQGLQRRGHVAVGTIRRSLPDGQVESLNFEVAELTTGGRAATLVLQPGDEIEILRGEERPPITVFIEGAVNKPGPYRMVQSQTAADLIRQADGLAPGAASFARLQSLVDGELRELRLELGAVARGGEPQPNPSLVNGDRLTIPTRAELGETRRVRVEGFVRSPGTYTLVEGLRLGDLLAKAGGLLPRAATRGKLIRVVPGTQETEVRYVDFTAALRGVEADNPVLREDDLVQVESAAAILAATDPVVSVVGPVARPGQYTRYVGMKVSDLIREAGGLHLAADRDLALLLRMTPEGRLQRLRLNPARAMAGAAEDDLELLDGDRLEFSQWRSITIAEPRVAAYGAVYQPGEYTLSQDMTLDELLHLAGGPTPEGYLPRAELHRRADAGRTRIVPVDLTLKPLAIRLADGDALWVYTHQQAIYREPTVEVKGDVQFPGVYERGEGMTLKDLLARAGGLTRNPAFMACEVARARGADVISLWPDLIGLMDGDERQDIVLEDGDSVFVRTSGDYLAKPSQVLVRGRVALPGFYPLTGRGGRDSDLADLLQQRAGGLLDGAFTEGAVLLRRIEEVTDPETARYSNEIWASIIARKRNQDYALLLSKNPTASTDRLKLSEAVLPTQIVTSDIPGSLGEEAVGEDLERELSAAETRTSLTPTILKHYVRVAIDLPAALAADTKFALRPNDIIIVPEAPQLVLVQGEVHSNMAQPYIEGQTVGRYLELAGGLTPGADGKRLLIIRANGNLQLAQPNTVVRRGDLILVPPKPLKLPSDRTFLENLQSIASVLGGLATVVLAITR